MVSSCPITVHNNIYIVCKKVSRFVKTALPFTLEGMLMMLQGGNDENFLIPKKM